MPVPRYRAENCCATRLESIQNRSFGPTKTSSIARTHSPAIHAYSIIRPHHPLPSLILLNRLIRLPAASMPDVFLSRPSVARLSVSVSVVKDSENWVEDALRARASVKREEVRSADSVSFASKRSGLPND